MDWVKETFRFLFSAESWLKTLEKLIPIPNTLRILSRRINPWRIKKIIAYKAQT